MNPCDLWLRFRNDPCLFVEYFWGHLKLARYQSEILESVRDNTETWTHSANEMGKSLCAALATIWWFATRKSKVITISPSQEQLEAILWAEIDSLLRTAHVGGHKFSFGFERTYLKLRLPGETESEDGEEKYAIRGKVVKQGETVGARMQQAIDGGERPRAIDADDLVDVLLALADELDPPVRGAERAAPGDQSPNGH